jgi:predicted flap endonuclease-1-like 5' DNA nuclease
MWHITNTSSLFFSLLAAQNSWKSLWCLWLIIIIVIILLLWYLWKWFTRPKSTTSQPTQPTPPAVKAAEAVIPQPEVKAPVAAVPIPASPIKPDDLTLIEGIGPKISSLLQAAGITTFTQLAEADLNLLKKILEDAGLQHLADPATWGEQAKLAADGKWEEFKALTDSLKGGRRVS